MKTAHRDEPYLKKLKEQIPSWKKETDLMDKCHRLEPIIHMIFGTAFIILSAWTIYNMVEYAHTQQEMNIEYNERIIKQQEEQFNRFLEVISKEE